jgi:hypothetical protein
MILDIKNTHSEDFRCSSDVYQSYLLSRQSSLFITCIEDVALDRFSDDIELNDYIKTQDVVDKRHGILSTLGDDRYKWSLINNISYEKTSIIEKLDKIYNILSSYIHISDLEKRIDTKVVTPLDKLGIPMIDMVSRYNNSFWENPYHKILDPCGGSGSLLILAIKKFMEGLKNIITNERDRFKWIIENCIYFGDKDLKTCFVWLCCVDIKSEYRLNIYWGDFIDDNFEYHMEEVWGIKRFDLIIQDPPFKKVNEKTDSFKDVYHNFIEKATTISKLSTSTSPGKWLGKVGRSDFRNRMINKLGLREIYKVDDNKVFEDFDLKGGAIISMIDSESNPKDDVLVNGEYVDLSKYDIIPNDTSKNSFLIIEKVINKKNITYRLNSEIHFGIITNDKRLYHVGQYKCHVSRYKGNIKYISGVDVRLKKIGRWKLLLPATSKKGGMDQEFYNRSVIAKPGEICSQSFTFFDFDTEEELLVFKKYLESDIFSYLVRLRKIKQHINSKVFMWVPDINIKEIIKDGKELDNNYFRDLLDIPRDIDLSLK